MLHDGDAVVRGQVRPSISLQIGVVEAMNPLEVWLFGSRAENRARETSDYDLLVVTPDGTPEAELDPVRAWRIGWDIRVTASCDAARSQDL